jgi:hypothetical protein
VENDLRPMEVMSILARQMKIRQVRCDCATIVTAGLIVNPMEERDRPESEFRNLKLMLYFMPVFGIIPALWSLNREDSTKSERNASRIAVKLALTWFASYMLFDVSAQNIEALHVPLLLTSSLITSGYFVMNLWLVILLWQRKSVDVPFLGRVDRLE